ncbi:MAG: cellulose-binding protein [Microcoleaceae cyanobacterium]
MAFFRFQDFFTRNQLRFISFLLVFSLTLIVALVMYRPWSRDNYGQPEPTVLAQSSRPTLALGVNLSGIANHSTQMPFIDVFKSARPWITQCNRRTDPGCTGKWDTKESDQLNLDASGWVKALPAPEDAPEFTRVTTVLNRGTDPYPGGSYVVLYDGEGTIIYGMDAEKNSAQSAPGRDVLNVTPSRKGMQLTITATDPQRNGNYLRNIRVMSAQYEQTYQQERFNPEFLTKTKPFKALRFMDWMATNHSPQKEWRDRPKVEDASYGYDKGVPLEVMASLANQLQADPWFNMPHQATDEYIKNFAQMAKDLVDPRLTIYVEYSNEVWNPIFKQHQWLAQNHPLGQQALHQAYGVRSAQMCDAWKEAFGQESQRVKCVMATHTGNRWVADQVLNCEQWEKAPCYQHGIDALAITAYFSGRLGELEHEKTVESWLTDPSVDEFKLAFKQLKDNSVLKDKDDSTASLVERFDHYAKVAQAKGLELLIYEGGSHVVGKKQVKNNEKLTQFFIELHRQPEFYDRYMEMLNAWKDSSGTRTLFMHFSDIGRYSKWGSWGALEHVSQASSSRYDALMDFIKQNP